ncbi:hypothetical protein RRG08_001909 [Elysia crispata]|uniref:Uncharacterized protein n=1 Tax=Elysia crispata TaxID=231223 RepID=A0AAE1A3J9_9GAST|nr:hypothetical protein RRG08_001909 [Elysia crispata]
MSISAVNSYSKSSAPFVNRFFSSFDRPTYNIEILSSLASFPSLASVMDETTRDVFPKSIANQTQVWPLMVPFLTDVAMDLISLTTFFILFIPSCCLGIVTNIANVKTLLTHRRSVYLMLAVVGYHMAFLILVYADPGPPYDAHPPENVLLLPGPCTLSPPPPASLSLSSPQSSLLSLFVETSCGGNSLPRKAGKPMTRMINSSKPLLLSVQFSLSVLL